MVGMILSTGTVPDPPIVHYSIDPGDGCLHIRARMSKYTGGCPLLHYEIMVDSSGTTVRIPPANLVKLSLIGLKDSPCIICDSSVGGLTNGQR